MPTDLSKAKLIAKAVPLILAENEVTPYAKQVAEEFNQIFYTINQRLAKCETLFAAGRVRDAVFSAEEEPNLLDLIERVEFPAADKWRSWCRENGLPVAERPTPKSLRALNEAYSQQQQNGGVDLYPHYREAFLAGDLLRALGTLRSILRLNVKDDKARSEMARLKEVYGLRQLNKLEEVLRSNSSAEVVQLVEEIEDLELTSAQTGKTWGKAQLVRSVDLIAKLAAAGDGAPLTEIRSALKTIEYWTEQLGVSLPENEEAIRQGLRQRIVREEQRQAERTRAETLRAKFRDSLATAQALVRNGAEDLTNSEVDASLESLRRSWDQAKTTPLIAESQLAQEYQIVCKKIEGVRGQILAKARRKRLRSVALSSAIVVLLLLYGIAELATSHFAAAMQSAVEQQDDSAASRYIKILPAASVVPFGYGKYGKAYKAAKEFVDKSVGTIKRIQQQLESAEFTKPDFENLKSASRFYAARKELLAQLGAIPKSAREQIDSRFRKQLDNAAGLEKVSVATLKTEYNKVIESAKKLAADSSENGVSLGVDSEIQELANQVSDCTMFAEYNLTLSEAEKTDLVRSVATVKGAISRNLDAQNDWRKMIDQMRGKTNLAEYIKAAKEAAGSKSASASLAGAAAQIDKDAVSDYFLASEIVSGEALKELRSKAATRGASPEGSSISLSVNRLLDDPIFNAEIHRYIIKYAKPENLVETWLTTGPLDTSSAKQTITGWVIESTDPNRIGSTFKGNLWIEAGLIHFGLDALLTSYSLVGSPVGPTVIDFCGVRDVIREKNVKATPLLLQGIVKVGQERNLIPSLKLYIIGKLGQLAKQEPSKYGLQYSPELLDFIKKLDAINSPGESPTPLFQSKDAESRNVGIESLCTEFVKKNHLNFFQTRLRLLDNIARDGFVFSGFMDSAGRLVLNSEQPSAELVVYDIATGTVGFGASLPKAAPLSPVFRMKTRKRDHLTRIRRELNGIESDALPNFFKN